MGPKMTPSPLGQNLLRILGVVSSDKEKKSKKNVPINLYTNFYFKVETKSDDSSSADLSVNSVESPDFEEIDFSTRRLTTANLRKVKKLHKSKSVEDWLNTIEYDGHILHGEHEHINIQPEPRGCCSPDKSEQHYACVDVTVTPILRHHDSPQTRMFARSRDIFQSYSSLSTCNLNLSKDTNNVTLARMQNIHEFDLFKAKRLSNIHMYVFKSNCRSLKLRVRDH